MMIKRPPVPLDKYLRTILKVEQHSRPTVKCWCAFTFSSSFFAGPRQVMLNNCQVQSHVKITSWPHMLQGNSVQNVIVSLLLKLAAHWSRAETGQISRGTELHCCCCSNHSVAVVVVGLHICCWCHPQLHWSSGGHWSFSASLGSRPSLQSLKADSWLRPAPRRAERLRGGLRIQDTSQNWKPEICVGSQTNF